ncbi:MAG: hypothetical protein AAF264_00195 [Pseudomonadota bacterium]
MVIAAKNYEPTVRGYQRIGGYERFDGRPRPSDASFWRLSFADGTSAPSEGDIVTGGASGASGTVLADAIALTGAFAGGDATGDLALYDATGTFQDGEDLQISGATFAVVDGVAAERDAANEADLNAFLRAAIEKRRAMIGPVPGSGPVRGVTEYGGSIYTFRDNAGGTACAIHRATSAGWVEVDTSGTRTVRFTAGTGAFVEGETLTDSGGQTATVQRVIVQRGAFAYTGDTPGDAEGYLVLSGASGALSSGAATGSGEGAANLSGADEGFVLSPGGRFAFTTHNFKGDALQARLYGCNGLDRAFEFDGTILAPIETGLSEALEKPTHIAEFSNHLFLGYETGLVQHSGIGNPLSFNAATDGAGSFSSGSRVTGFIQSASSALVILGRNRVSYMTGTSAIDFTLTVLADDAGAVEWTNQLVGSPIYLDDAGVRRMATTQAYGNWKIGTITQLITPFFDEKQAAGILPVASVRSRGKDQYRLFYADGSGLTIYFGQKNPEALPFELPFVVSAACVGVLAEDELIFAGSEDGCVYQMDAGTSFDGQEVEAFVLFAFNHLGSPQQQ